MREIKFLHKEIEHKNATIKSLIDLMGNRATQTTTVESKNVKDNNNRYTMQPVHLEKYQSSKNKFDNNNLITSQSKIQATIQNRKVLSTESPNKIAIRKKSM